MLDSHSPPAAAPTGLAALDALLQPFDRGDAPGLLVGIDLGGRPLYRRGFGLASIEHGVANTVATRMRIGSTSKHFTCLAALLLAEQGRLQLDDPVHQHLPELPRLGEVAPTLRQLMNHTSGWRCHLDLYAAASGFAIQPKGSGLPLLMRQSALNFEPGSLMIYSNGGYHLLSRVIERVSGQGFEAFMAQHLFEPMGMVDTEAVQSDFEVHTRKASGYLPLPPPQSGWRRAVDFDEEMLGEGSMVSTLEDMLRWLAHLRGGDRLLGSAVSWAQMLAPTVLSNGTVLPYGLGLFRHDYRGVEVVHHAGGVVGGGAQMLTVPSHGLNIVIMSNGVQASPRTLAFKIVDMLLAEQLDHPPPEHALASRYSALVGRRYHDPHTGRVLGFAEVDGLLGLVWLNAGPLPLWQREQMLGLGIQDVSIGPIEIDVSGIAGLALDQAPAALAVGEGGQVRRFDRLPEQGPPAAAMAAMLRGAYEVPDLDASAHIELDGEQLLLRVKSHYGHRTLRLTPLTPNLLAGSDTDPLLGGPDAGCCIFTIERHEGLLTGLRLDQFRTRDLRFFRKTS